MSMTLRAVRPILYRSNQYREGDALPADNAGTVEAWLEAGSAKWLEDEEPAEAPKARRVSPPPGEKGISSDGDPEARAGRIPDTPEREKPKAAPRKKSKGGAK